LFAIALDNIHNFSVVWLLQHKGWQLDWILPLVISDDEVYVPVQVAHVLETKPKVNFFWLRAIYLIVVQTQFVFLLLFGQNFVKSESHSKIVRGYREKVFLDEPAHVLEEGLLAAEGSPGEVLEVGGEQHAHVVELLVGLLEEPHAPERRRRVLQGEPVEQDQVEVGLAEVVELLLVLELQPPGPEHQCLFQRLHAVQRPEARLNCVDECFLPLSEVKNTIGTIMHGLTNSPIRPLIN
jgi:hypothetical protein